MNADLAACSIAHSVADGESAKETLRPITRNFSAGSMTVIGGSSGAGKTTLLSLLALAVRPSRGQIFHCGRELTSLVPDSASRWRRETIGLVFQTSRLVSSMSLREHFEMAARLRRRSHQAIHERGRSLLSLMGIGDRIDHLPSKLSGGEKQRAAIAQALCFDPAIVLADEPTAALDEANAEIVASTLRLFASSQNAIVICVSHDRTMRTAADDYFELDRPS